MALAVKEMHFLPKEVIEQRFNIANDEGVVIEMFGKITKGMMGTAFLYTNRESIALGIGCMADDFKKGGITPYDMLDEMKKHPAIKPLIAGSEVKEYAAHLIPEGGYKAIPQVHGDGWVICGDSGGFVNAVHREGSNLAMTTGRLAAETIIKLKEEGKPFTAQHLAAYRAQLEASFVMKDLKKYKEMPEIFHANPQFFTTYPELLNKAAATMLKVDNVDKKTKQKEIAGEFVKRRSYWGMLGDAIKLVRSFR